MVHDQAETFPVFPLWNNAAGYRHHSRKKSRDFSETADIYFFGALSEGEIKACGITKIFLGIQSVGQNGILGIAPWPKPIVQTVNHQIDERTIRVVSEEVLKTRGVDRSADREKGRVLANCFLCRRK